MKLHFVTSNIKKVNEIARIFQKELPKIEIKQISIDIPEFQGDPLYVARNKIEYCINSVEDPYIIEDTSLCFNALAGLPGVYIKDFIEKIGQKNVYKLLDGFEDKSAYSQCIIGYYSKKNIKFFTGRNYGKITCPENINQDNFSWDPLFIPDGYLKTYSEMSIDEKNLISHRSKAIEKLIKYLKYQEIKEL